jgi:pectate lyase
MAGLKPTQPPPDADRDGMPDEWEKKHGLDPARDDSARVMPSGYTAIEGCLDGRAKALVTGH